MAADRFVGRARKAAIENVLGGVSERLDSPRECRRQLCVDEEVQLRVPQDRVIVLAGGELQHRRDVLVFEERVVREDLFPVPGLPHKSRTPPNWRFAPA